MMWRCDVPLRVGRRCQPRRCSPSEVKILNTNDSAKKDRASLREIQRLFGPRLSL